MNTSEYPSLAVRIGAVWYRHFRVYTKNLVSNGLPPFLEPLIFLAGIGLGLGKYISTMDNMPYIEFLATGLLVSTAMFTAAFECSYGTFLRLEFDKVYDGMLAAPITVGNLFTGEILWAGTKGFFFSAAVLTVMSFFGVLPLPWSLFAPIVGFITGIMFSSLSLLITSFIKSINHLNFYFTGIISPMFFFSGIVFPVSTLPPALRPVAEIFPLTHAVFLVRAFAFHQFPRRLVWDAAYCVVFSVVIGFLAVHRLRKRIVQ